MTTQIILQNLIFVLFLLVQLPHFSSNSQESATTEASVSLPISANIQGYR
ncbi:MAG: hypothetical protein ACRC11_03420 [Xenococcaceae cyanobacterium]